MKKYLLVPFLLFIMMGSIFAQNNTKNLEEDFEKLKNKVKQNQSKKKENEIKKNLFLRDVIVLECAYPSTKLVNKYFAFYQGNVREFYEMPDRSILESGISFDQKSNIGLDKNWKKTAKINGWLYLKNADSDISFDLETAEHMYQINGIVGQTTCKKNFLDKPSHDLSLSDTDYPNTVRRKLLPLIIFDPALVTGNPIVEVGLELSPNGKIIHRQILKSSGYETWDLAVLKAIDEAQYLPRDSNGKVPKQIRLRFRPKY